MGRIILVFIYIFQNLHALNDSDIFVIIVVVAIIYYTGVIFLPTKPDYLWHQRGIYISKEKAMIPHVIFFRFQDDIWGKYIYTYTPVDEENSWEKEDPGGRNEKYEVWWHECVRGITSWFWGGMQKMALLIDNTNKGVADSLQMY